MSEPVLTLIAIGNRNVGDDGIGLFILEAISHRVSKTIDVQLWEDKDALSITADLLEIHTPIVMVDCADMGITGGEYRWFNAEECSLSQHLQGVSTHGFGFSEALELARTLGFEQTLYFFAIQPVQLELSQILSPVLQNNKEAIANALVQQVQQLEEQLSQGSSFLEKGTG